MSELTNIHARAVKDLTTPTELPVDPDALDQVKLVAGNFPPEYVGNEAVTVGLIKELAANGRKEELDAVNLKITEEETRAKEVEATLIKDKANKATTLSGYGITDAYTQGQIDSKVNNLENKKANKVNVDTALSNLSTTANKYYSTLAAANADIANIALNQSVTIGEEANSGLWEKKTTGATSLTKSPYDPKLQALLESRAYVDERVAKAATGNVHPIVVDPKGDSPLWLDNGRLGFTELEPSSQERVKSQMGLGDSEASNIVPIAADPKGYCPLWIQNGLLNFAGIHANAVQLIKEQLGDIDPQKKNNTTGAAYPILSDGASLVQWKAKASRIKSGVAQQVRLLITGDSWTEHKTITNEILPMVRAEYAEAGSGWINLGVENNQLDNISVSKSGTWGYRDLDAATAFPHGSGPDGFILTSTSSGNVLNVNNLSKGDKLTVFYGKADGSFKYSINGGAETTITSSASGSTVQSTTIDVSADSNIVFTTLSGTVVLFGLHLRKSTGSGVEVTKVGNGNATGLDYSKISPTAQADFNNYLKPDLVIIILGTNDYRHGRTVASFKAGILAIINGYRTNNADCGFILIAPARSNASSSIPLSDFRDAIYEIAQEQKCEFYNMYDDWGQYSVENGNGMWNDSLHVSKSGAYRIAKKLFKNFLEI